MPRGGARSSPKMGRPKGSVNKRNAAIAQLAAKDGVTPVEAMLEAMRYHHDKALALPDGDLKIAHYGYMAEYAAKAAPYCHPRLANVEVTGAGGGPIEHIVSHEERAEQAAELLAFAKRRMAATGSRNGHSN